MSDINSHTIFSGKIIYTKTIYSFILYAMMVFWYLRCTGFHPCRICGNGSVSQDNDRVDRCVFELGAGLTGFALGVEHTLLL